ncbi:hypothetical protein DUI87_13053 [Hirundo rustica rustica]|uniref:Uncharacterized protein n=1 Tax=Hirundo rustica rustica TaxID=333673 RepID=A0A3M0KCL4_HIRRU|nr:hypothetical protein DUI87_13053 [Hirundo rustica rustica]
MDRLERWVCANLMKFSKANCRVLPLGRQNPKHKYRLDAEQTETSTGKEDLVVFVNEKLNMTWQNAFAAQKAKCILSCIKRGVTRSSREVILSLYSGLLRRHLECCIQV